MELEKETLLNMYRRMVLIRRFEEKLYDLFMEGTMPGTMHQYIGQEAVAVGVCENLNKNDYVTSTHRGHGHCIAKGADLKGIMAEVFAKKTGCCKGMGGSMHIADFSVGMLGAIGIVGAGIPIAMGAGLSIKYRKTKQVSVSFFGDGASNEGSFHESINMAAVWKLPVIFVCENNFYGFSTPIKQVIPTDNIAVRAQAYNIPGVIADGMDVMEVYRVAKEAVERARQGLGPTLIECRTYRYKGHSRFEKPTYRREEEVKEWMQKDPIPKLKDYLLKNSICDENKIISIENEIEIELQESVEFAKNSPLPEDDIALKLVFKEG